MKGVIFKLVDFLGEEVVRLYDFFFSTKRKKEQTPKKILLIKTMMIGDVLFTTPSIVAIRRKFPEVHIDMLVGNWSKDAVTENPHINRIISYDDTILLRHKPIDILKLAWMLKKEDYDWTINFHRSRSMNLLTFIVGSPVRIGLDYKGSGFALTKKVCSDPTLARYPVEMYLDIPRAMGINLPRSKIEIYFSREDIDYIEQLFISYNVNKNDIIIAVCPGGATNPGESVPARRWSPERFAELCDSIAVKFDAKIVLLGSREDKKICENVSQFMVRKPVNLTGATTLKQLAALLKRCLLLVTNDSAPLHVAVAVNTSTVSLFGPTCGKARIPNDGMHLAIQSPLECSPCYGNENKFPGCKYGNPRCMDAISVRSVLCAVERQLLQV